MYKISDRNRIIIVSSILWMLCLTGDFLCSADSTVKVRIGIGARVQEKSVSIPDVLTDAQREMLWLSLDGPVSLLPLIAGSFSQLNLNLTDLTYLGHLLQLSGGVLAGHATPYDPSRNGSGQAVGSDPEGGGSTEGGSTTEGGTSGGSSGTSGGSTSGSGGFSSDHWWGETSDEEVTAGGGTSESGSSGTGSSTAGGVSGTGTSGTGTTTSGGPSGTGLTSTGGTSGTGLNSSSGGSLTYPGPFVSGNAWSGVVPENVVQDTPWNGTVSGADAVDSGNTSSGSTSTGTSSSGSTASSSGSTSLTGGSAYNGTPSVTSGTAHDPWGVKFGTVSVIPIGFAGGSSNGNAAGTSGSSSTSSSASTGAGTSAGGLGVATTSGGNLVDWTDPGLSIPQNSGTSGSTTAGSGPTVSGSGTTPVSSGTTPGTGGSSSPGSTGSATGVTGAATGGTSAGSGLNGSNGATPGSATDVIISVINPPLNPPSEVTPPGGGGIPTSQLPPAVQPFSGIIQGIKFDYNSASLKSSSYAVLNNAAQTLTDYPNVTIEIVGHTDNKGSAEGNFRLGQRRADAVKNYLVSKGIAASRLKTSSAGEKRPLATNMTDAGRAMNRRTEFIVLSQ